MSIFHKIKVAIIIIILFFVTGEIYLRLMGWKEKMHLLQDSSDPDIQWVPTPNYEGYHRSQPGLIKLNSKGLRDYEYTYEKPKDTFRIFIVGECTVFGVRVLMPEKFAKQLEVMLNDRPIFKDFKHYEVISAGIVQWDDYQKVAYAEKYGLKYNPDLIIFSHDIGTKQWFDHRRNLRWYRKIDHMIPKQIIFMRYLYRKAGNCLTALLNFTAEQQTKLLGEIKYILRLYKENSLYFTKSKKALKRLSQLSNDNRIPVMVLFFPWLNYLESKPYPFGKVSQSYDEICQQYNIPILNLTHYFLDDDPKLFSMIGPPSSFIHRVVAEKLYDFLGQNFQSLLINR